MANKNKIVKERENLMLGGHLSELDWVPRSEEQISAELFKGTNPDKIIDAFEERMGIPIKETNVSKQIYKCVDLRPFDEEDRLLLQKFYNNPDQYQVLKRSDNWTHRGELIIFLEYYENIDVKLEKEKEQENQP